jgi:hypothetical protein
VITDRVPDSALETYRYPLFGSTTTLAGPSSTVMFCTILLDSPLMAETLFDPESAT